jgi:RNA polymerase II-associated protein 1
MAVPGQRFELDLDAETFALNALDDSGTRASPQTPMIKEIQEHDSLGIPTAPQIKQTKSGFPEHRTRRNVSTFRQKQDNLRGKGDGGRGTLQSQPSDAAIRHHVSNTCGYDPTSAEKLQIGEDNRQRLATMSEEDIKEAREELLQSLSPALIERFLRRANIDEDQDRSSPRQLTVDALRDGPSAVELHQASIPGTTEPGPLHEAQHLGHDTSGATTPPSSIHFPKPPRNPADYKKLDPNSPSFLKDLRLQYFPALSHNPSSLDWLQSAPQEPISYSYGPDLDSYPASSLRFNFAGNLIAPSTSHSIPVSAGLHHHGDAPDAAGYTIPELTLLTRSTLPNQRCIAYQTTGRLLYRLGKGSFGQPGNDLNEALWEVVEEQRVLELIMAEANRESGHASAKAYAIEAVWLWRKGGGGERGLKKPSEKRAT